MAHSIEARVPFLDYRLVEFVFSLPDEWKIRDTESKYLLREALKGTLPESIRTRKDKLGFRADPNWTFDVVRENAGAILHSETEYERRWFNPGGLEKLLLGGDRTVSTELELWRALNTKLWARQHWGSGPVFQERSS